MKSLIIQNSAIVGPGLIEKAMEAAGWELDIRLMERPGSVLPGNLDAYHSLVILGGPMSANEERLYPHLKKVCLLFQEAFKKDLPTLGICLGGQLMARALGAAVTPNPLKEIGWFTLRLTADGLDSPLFEGMPEEFPVFQWHEDTFSLPSCSTLLASTTSCTNQAFSIGSNSYALQFHLEITPEIIKKWVSVWGDELEEEKGFGATDSLFKETGLIWGKYYRLANRILKNWLAKIPK
ncbi:MAG: type 1 glutamine amidotransferase [Pelotomaculum sp.]|nr:type 1 glutamine amidotransferase [Pelotomaculum sp.]